VVAMCGASSDFAWVRRAESPRGMYAAARGGALERLSCKSLRRAG
jgi:hypothetical protein